MTTTRDVVRVGPVGRVLRSQFPPLPHRQRIVSDHAVPDHLESLELTATFTQQQIEMFERLIGGLVRDLRKIIDGKREVLGERGLAVLTDHLNELSSIELGPPGTYPVSKCVALDLVRWGCPLSIDGRTYSRKEAVRYLAAETN